jgi:hypothetical protein
MISKDQSLLEEAYDQVMQSQVKIPEFKFMQSGKEHIQAGEDHDATNNHSWDLVVNGKKVGELKEYGIYGEAEAKMVAPGANRSSTPGFLSLDLSGFSKGDNTIEKFKLALATKTGQRFLARLKQVGADYIK